MIVWADCANGVSFFPDPSRAMLAVSSGQRHYDLPDDMRDDDDPIISMTEATKEHSDRHRNVVEVYDFAGGEPEAPQIVSVETHQ